MKERRSIDYLLSERERKSLAILEQIRRKGPISRTDIAKNVDTNIVTVSNYIDGYIRKGFVFESGIDISSGGRKPTLVKLNPRAGFAIGIDLSASEEVIVFICDLSGKETAKIRSAVVKKPEEDFAGELPVIINKLIKKAEIGRSKLKGIGLALSGEDKEKDFYSTIKKELEQSFDLPVFTGNGATFAAFGEKMLGLEDDFENMLYMYSDIGCGIIIKGNIYCGAGGSAGELGINRPQEKDFFYGAPGPRYLKTKEGDFGISSRAKKVVSEGVNSLILKKAQGNIENITVNLVIEAARDGDKLAEELIENAGVDLGIRIAYLVNLFNPEVVVIGGGVEAAGSIFLDPVRKTMQRWALEASTKQIKIVPARLGKEAVAWGAASIVLREVFIQT